MRPLTILFNMGGKRGGSVIHEKKSLISRLFDKIFN